MLYPDQPPLFNYRNKMIDTLAEFMMLRARLESAGLTPPLFLEPSEEEDPSEVNLVFVKHLSIFLHLPLAISPSIFSLLLSRALSFLLSHFLAFSFPLTLFLSPHSFSIPLSFYFYRSFPLFLIF